MGPPCLRSSGLLDDSRAVAVVVVVARAEQANDGNGDEEEEEEDDGDEEGDDGPQLSVGLTGESTIEFSLDEPEQHTQADRQPLLDALRDAHAEAKNAFEPKLRSWLLVLSRVTLPDAELPAQRAMLERVTSLRGRLRSSMSRGELLNSGGMPQPSSPATPRSHAQAVVVVVLHGQSSTSTLCCGGSGGGGAGGGGR